MIMTRRSKETAMPGEVVTPRICWSERNKRWVKSYPKRKALGPKRAAGRNSRALGTNPRATGSNPRDGGPA
jgi:hypothetical protein